MTYTFSLTDFTHDYIDPDGDIACKISILTNPIMGQFYLNNTLINAPFELNSCDINKLEYRINDTLFGNDYFNFYVIDSNIKNPIKSNMATFNINIEQRANQKPDVVGDQTITIANAQVIVLTSAMFTTTTTPPYHDPENDAPYQLRILSLPSSGTLKLNNVNVTVNQVINFSNITSGQLTYTADPSNITAHSTLFTFAVSDVGSQQFTQ